MTHTPGPWKHDEVWSLIIGANGAEVAALHAGEPDGVSQRESRHTVYANAALIAAAPDLLAALRAIRDYARDSRTGRMLTHEGYELAEAAIAKAEGR